MEAYLDNAATTRCSREAAERMMQVLLEDYGNPSSLHGRGITAENHIKEARGMIAKTLRADAREIIFTSGGTEANNLAIAGAVQANRRGGNRIITSAIEHASVAAPFAALKEQGFEVVVLPVDRVGRISLEALEEAMTADTILVSLMMVNNEIGTIQPIEEAARIIKTKNPHCLFHVDAIQAYGKLEVYPKKAGVDLLSVSGHKIHGPKGSGCLYVGEKVKVRPQLLGGGQERGMRSGTENVPAAVGLGIAAAQMQKRLRECRQEMYRLREIFVTEAVKISGVSINGALGEAAAPHIVSVSVEDVRSEVFLHALEEKGVYVSAGSACSSNKPTVSATLRAIGLPERLLDSTVRFSFSAETSEEEIRYALKCMEELIPMLQKFTRH